MLYKLAVLLGFASFCLSAVQCRSVNDQVRRSWIALLAVVIHMYALSRSHLQAGRRLNQVRLDYNDQYHAHQHAHGAEVIAWLSDVNNVHAGC